MRFVRFIVSASTVDNEKSPDFQNRVLGDFNLVLAYMDVLGTKNLLYAGPTSILCRTVDL